MQKNMKGINKNQQNSLIKANNLAVNLLSSYSSEGFLDNIWRHRRTGTFRLGRAVTLSCLKKIQLSVHNILMSNETSVSVVIPEIIISQNHFY